MIYELIRASESTTIGGFNDPIVKPVSLSHSDSFRSLFYYVLSYIKTIYKVSLYFSPLLTNHCFIGEI